MSPPLQIIFGVPLANIWFKWVHRQPSLELSSFCQEWLWFLQDKYIKLNKMYVGCPFPTCGGSEKSLPLKTTAINSKQADLAYLLRKKLVELAHFSVTALRGQQSTKLELIKSL